MRADHDVCAGRAERLRQSPLLSVGHCCPERLVGVDRAKREEVSAACGHSWLARGLGGSSGQMGSPRTQEISHGYHYHSPAHVAD
jgi:hypothetical protein